MERFCNGQIFQIRQVTTQKSCFQKHTVIQAFCSGMRDKDEHPTLSIVYLNSPYYWKNASGALSYDIISVRTCYNSILLPWNSRAITCMCTQCIPGPFLGLGIRLHLCHAQTWLAFSLIKAPHGAKMSATIFQWKRTTVIH